MASGELVIAVDGPAASGKSTVALALARALGLELVDSGSMYRAVTLRAIETGTSTEDVEGLVELAGEVASEFGLRLADGEGLRVFLGDREVTAEVRSPEVGGCVSPVSTVPGVRQEMVRLQRRLVDSRRAVVEGRDIGTTVLPDAPLKVYLEASEEERARRRLDELLAKGIPTTAGEVSSEIRSRDSIDSSRETSPLRAAPDAVVIDTSDKPVAAVVDEIVALLADRGLIH